MNLESVLCKYNLIGFSRHSWYYIYQKRGIYNSNWHYWHYQMFGLELECLPEKELMAMSAEELENLAVGCSLLSMAPELCLLRAIPGNAHG
jgi:hypothetical protein